MADLSNGSSVFQTYNNAGTGVAELGDNKLPANGDTNGIAGLTRVIKLAKSSITDAEIQAALDYIQAGDVSGTNDANTVVGLDKNTNDAFVVVQGTGVMTAGSNYGTGSTGVTMSIEATIPGISG
jgi:hypothetical protein|tara:strand:+ start:1876 stop:2250 length:375 start_codon:yes stop_codon:yes gene_type:complete